MPAQQKSKTKPIQVHTNERVVNLLDFVEERRRAGKNEKTIAGELGVTTTVLRAAIARAKQNGDQSSTQTKSEERKSRSERRAEAHRALIEKVLDLSDKNLDNVAIANELDISESVVLNVLNKYRP